MPVKRAFAVLLLAACSKQESDKPKTVDVSWQDAAPPVVKDDSPPEYTALARAAIDAVKTLASRCELYAYENTEFDRIIDSCGIWKAAEVEALTRARKALEASTIGPKTGFAPSFVKQVQTFDDMSSKLYKNEQGYWAERGRGVPFRYQELALLWNSWRPASEAVPVDVAQQRAVKVTAGASGHIEWGHCSSGPCIVRSRTK